MTNVQIAKALGWVSLAIGASEIIAPGWLQKQMGIGGHNKLLRSYGMREIIAGAGLLAASNPQSLGEGLWGRVAGDALDVASLAAAAPSTRKPIAFAVFTAAILGITAVDAIYASRLQPEPTKGVAGRMREWTGG